MNNQYFKPQAKPSKLIIFLLFLSFMWVTAYTSLSSLVYDFYYNYGNVFDSASPIFSNAVFYWLITGTFSWLWVEVIFIIYRFILSFRIYSFIVPPYKLKDEMRTFFIYRNLMYGLFLNLCFILPYFYSLSILVELVITMTTCFCFARHISKKYSETLIAHFVYKCFITPVLFFETISVFLHFLGVM